MASADDKFVLRVELQEGRGFGFELQALSCTATFGGEAKSTPFSVGKDAHAWHSTLQWRVTRQQLRALSNSGQAQCKVTVNKKGQDRALGWFVLDTRKARLNADYKKTDGEPACASACM